MLDKREFLMLANEWVPGKHDIGGWWMSSKLDGMRAWWDGGISRGLPASQVPYANVAKDARYVKPPIATGLWSRYGKVIQAPPDWLDGLPLGVNLDMELWAGNQSFQRLMSSVKTLVPDDLAWQDVVGMVIDAPGWEVVLTDGQLTGTNWKGVLHSGMLDWVRERCTGEPFQGLGMPDECFKKLADLHEGACSWEPMAQVKLPRHPDDAAEIVLARLQEVTAAGGEGLILRSPQGSWYPKRVNWLLKVKKLSDAEGTVTGFTWGRETALGSRHLGRMGALVVVTKPGSKEVRLELSGFTDEERAVQLVHADGTKHQLTSPCDESRLHEGKDASDAYEPVEFPRGTTVTYTYRELTRDGVPKEARYMRKRPEE